MAALYGGVRGRAGEATRLGNQDLHTFAQTWHRQVNVDLDKSGRLDATIREIGGAGRRDVASVSGKGDESPNYWAEFNTRVYDNPRLLVDFDAATGVFRVYVTRGYMGDNEPIVWGTLAHTPATEQGTSEESTNS